jgi:hypothetical protein
MSVWYCRNLAKAQEDLLISDPGPSGPGNIMEAVFGENCSFLSSTLFIRSIPGVSREYLRSIYGVTSLYTESIPLVIRLASLTLCQVPYYQCFIDIYFPTFCQLRTNVGNKEGLIKCWCPFLDVLSEVTEFSAPFLEAGDYCIVLLISASLFYGIH